jgi:hypothetical protein
MTLSQDEIDALVKKELKKKSKNSSAKKIKKGNLSIPRKNMEKASNAGGEASISGVSINFTVRPIVAGSKLRKKRSEKL